MSSVELRGARIVKGVATDYLGNVIPKESVDLSGVTREQLEAALKSLDVSDR